MPHGLFRMRSLQYYSVTLKLRRLLELFEFLLNESSGELLTTLSFHRFSDLTPSLGSELCLNFSFGH